MPLTFNAFQGANKALDPKLLPDGVGIVSTNQRPGKGDMRPWRAANNVATVPTASARKTIWRMGQDTASDANYWLSWTTIVHAIRGWDNPDTTERTYFTGSGAPKWTNNVMALGAGDYPIATQDLGVPAPTGTPLAAINTEPAGDVPDETVYFTTTFVNSLGWESAPSLVSNTITARPGTSIDLTLLDAAPAGYDITIRRIYKTKVGTGGEVEFFYRGEQAAALSSYADSGSDLGSDVLATGFYGAGTSWGMPPSDGACLTAMWNGMAAMITGKTVRICEPNKIYAWPARYEIIVPHTPVALAVFGERMLVLTTGDVYLVTGSEPLGLSCEPLKIMQPCSSVRSVVAFPDGVVWASPQGLCWFGQDGYRMLTEGLIDQSTNPDNPLATSWNAMDPTTMIASRYHGLVFLFYTEATVSKGIAIHPSGKGGLYFLDQGYEAVFHDPVTDAMYVMLAGDVKRFDASSSLMTATFKSKVQQLHVRTVFSAIEVIAQAYPCTLSVWLDGTLVVNARSVTSQAPFRPGASCVGETVQIQVASSAGAVTAVRLGVDMDDLRQ